MERSFRIDLLVMLAIVVAISTGAWAQQLDDEYDLIVASIGTSSVHWWEEVSWKKNANLTNQAIEIAHAGETVYIDYFKFVNVETGQTTMWTKFDTLQPDDAWLMAPTLQNYPPSSNQWAIRTDHLGNIGGQTLYAYSVVSPPPITFNPELTGRYDIYVGVRATHMPMSVRLRIIEAANAPEGEAANSDSPKSMHHFVIAEDDDVYYAWPSVARRPNGELLVIAYKGKAHSRSHGQVVLYRSEDGGRTWDEGSIVADTILDDRDPGILVTRDDTILVTSRVAFWEDGVDIDEINPYLAQILLSKFEKGYLIRSDDGGETWSEMRPYPFQPKGPIELADGTLFAASRESSSTIRTYTSSDKGDTWWPAGKIEGLPQFLEEGGIRWEMGYWEPHFVERADGRIIVYIRAHSMLPANSAPQTSQLWLSYSDDMGQSWSKPERTNIQGFPPHALRLHDDRLLISYGYRWRPFGQRAILTDDGIDFTKYDEVIIRDDSISSDLGYPTSVEINDGRILTVYYEQRASGGKTALMGTIWCIR